MTVKNLEWKLGSNRVSWLCGGKSVARINRLPFQSVCILKECDGLAIVESIEETGPRNALLVNCDGSERARLDLSFPVGSMQGFDCIYYIQGKLAAIIITTLGDWTAEVNPLTGKLSRIRESR